MIKERNPHQFSALPLKIAIEALCTDLVSRSFTKGEVSDEVVFSVSEILSSISLCSIRSGCHIKSNCSSLVHVTIMNGGHVLIL